MHEQSPQEVLDLARQRMALNRQQEQTRHAQERQTRDQPWRILWVSVVGILLLVLLVPPAPLDWKMYAVVHGLVAQQHNMFLGGMQFPLCARNIGIYSSFLVTITGLWAIGRWRAGRIPPRPIMGVLIALALIMVVDGFNSMFAELGQPHLYPPHNALRIVTGIGMGTGMAIAILLAFNYGLRQDTERQQRVVATWRDLGFLLGLNLLIPAAIYANLDFLYWPLATLAFVGILSELYVVNVLMAGMLMGYQRSITHLAQLARPATVAFIPAFGLVAFLAHLRFWLEGYGLFVGF
jgi:uncharacterized membrane protein